MRRLCPIAGIDKAFFWTWLRWLETQGPLGSAPDPSPGGCQPDAADRRVAAAVRRADRRGRSHALRVLDAIERAAIRDKRRRPEVFRTRSATVFAVSHGPVAALGRAVFPSLVPQSVESGRYAPSFHLDDENLDPKTWCRFPILSGGFERELAELREYVAGIP